MGRRPTCIPTLSTQSPVHPSTALARRGRAPHPGQVSADEGGQTTSVTLNQTTGGQMLPQA